MKKILKNMAIVALMSGGMFSCNYLDTADEMMQDDYTVIFENANRTRRWIGELMTSVPDYAPINTTGSMSNPWTAYADEIYHRWADYDGMYGDYSSSRGISQRWQGLYERIRQANIFLATVHPISNVSDPNYDNPATMSPDEVRMWKGIARFMRAVYHYYLMEQYGPVPIIDRELLLSDELNLPRASVDELVNWLDTEFAESMVDLNQEPYSMAETDINYRATPTKGVAMAYRAKLWVYAASPLLNGGFTEALSLTNPDGKQIFPAKDDGTKVNNAVKYLREFLDYAEAGRYELYYSADRNPAKSVYEVFQAFNKEIIFISSRNSWGNVSGDYGTDRYSTPRCEPGGLADIHIVQELVDDFYMADGYPIEATSFLPQSTTYTEAGFGQLDGFEVSNMYIGREPRFYNTVTFSGKKWHVTNREVQLYKGGNADNSATDGAPKTGYFLYKRYNRTVSNTGNNPKSFARPSIIFRLAEFHLLYAEMLNEKDPSNPDVLKYLNSVRDRAGLPKIEEINPAIAGNQALQRDAIRRESRIELATEGQRYFDVRRWMIAESAEGRQGGAFHGMNVAGNKVAFHTRTVWHTRHFARKNYLFPIPQAQVQLSGGQLVQNPGW
jgi:hypothetical protein